jgi:hypothetical protein
MVSVLYAPSGKELVEPDRRRAADDPPGREDTLATVCRRPGGSERSPRTAGDHDRRASRKRRVAVAGDSAARMAEMAATP